MPKFKIIVLALVTAAILAVTGAIAVVGAAAMVAGEAVLPPMLLSLAGILGIGAAASQKEGDRARR